MVFFSILTFSSSLWPFFLWVIFPCSVGVSGERFFSLCVCQSLVLSSCLGAFPPSFLLRFLLLCPTHITYRKEALLVCYDAAVFIGVPRDLRLCPLPALPSCNSLVILHAVNGRHLPCINPEGGMAASPLLIWPREGHTIQLSFPTQCWQKWEGKQMDLQAFECWNINIEDVLFMLAFYK